MTSLGNGPSRIILIGDSSVGKTSILTTLTGDQFNPSERSTIGANWHLLIEEINGERIELQIWDTAGQECYRSLGPLYYRSAVAGIVVFDVTNQASFSNVNTWINAFRATAGKDVPIFLVGNKIDLVNQRVIGFDDANQFANEQNFEFFETSAKVCHGIRELFHAVAEKVAQEGIVRDDIKVRRLLLNF
jgi:small GTP-binding protein